MSTKNYVKPKINADREYRITFTNSNVTLSSLKLKFDTNQ